MPSFVRSAREEKQAGVDVRDADEAVGRDREAVVGERAGAGQAGDLHREQIVGGRFVRVGETKVGRVENERHVLKRRDGIAGSNRRVIDPAGVEDVDRHGAGDGIEIDAAVGRAAVILHLEGQACISNAGRVVGGRELEIAAVDVAVADDIVGADRAAVVGERPRAGQRDDLDAAEAVGRRIAWVGEPEVCRREDVVSVLERDNGIVRADRGIVDAGDVDGHGARSAVDVGSAVGGAAVVLNFEAEAGEGRVAFAGGWIPDEAAQID